MTSPHSETAEPQPRPNNLVGAAILALFVAFGAGIAFGPPAATGPLTFGFVFTGWILAVMAHEFAHAFTAWRAGDHTVPEKGYLSFDPRRYGDLGTSLVIPLLALALGGIGFPGGAVWLRHDLMRSKAWRAAASLAGPGATLVVLVVLGFLLMLWSRVALPGPLFNAVAFLAFLQAMALILNLLPIPGLDGFNAIRPFLPKSWAPAIHKFEGLALIGLLAVIFFVPGASAALFLGAAWIAQAFGVPFQAWFAGYDTFRFWT